MNMLSKNIAMNTKYNNRARKLVELVNYRSEGVDRGICSSPVSKEQNLDNEKRTCCSPLTEDQKKILKEFEQNDDLLQIYEEIIHSPSLITEELGTRIAQHSDGSDLQKSISASFTTRYPVRSLSLPPCSVSNKEKNKNVRSSSLPPVIPVQLVNRLDPQSPISIKDVPDPFATDSGSDEEWRPSTSKRRRYANLTAVTYGSQSNADNLLEDDESSEESVSGERVKTKKRLRNINKWKREIAKKKRLEGKKYVSAVSKKKKIIQKREMKEGCSDRCRLKCQTKINNETRSAMFTTFWKTMTSWDQRRQFIASSIDLVPVMRPRHRQNNDESRRKKTRIYNFVTDGNRFHVCQKMFLNTLCVTEQFISTTLSKVNPLTNAVEPDRRGKHVPANKTPDPVIDKIKYHISLFPRYTSHYSREKSSREYLGPEWNIAKMYAAYLQQCNEHHVPAKFIAKEWLYRKIFNEEFNLAFYSPSNDTCDTCDKYNLQLKQETNINEIKKIEDMRKEHLNDASNRYSLKKKDKEYSKQSNGETLTLMLDMQKCLATPLLTNTASFYLRKLWVLNETLHDDTSNKSYCMMWNETLGGRGANEVGSCIIEWALNYLDPTVKEITVWSDNCSGQNRNIMIVYCYFWLLKFTNLTVINHKFLLRGHIHSEVDAVHSIIERKKKEMPQFDIMVPRDWEQFVKVCKPKNPLIVHSMNLSNIKDIKSLKTHFSQRRKNASNDQFLISNCVWLQTRKSDNGVLYYKTSFNDEEFSRLDLRKNTRQQLNLPRSIPQCNIRQRPISNAKYKDLISLTNWMSDSTVKNYYMDLPHGTVPDIDTIDNE